MVEQVLERKPEVHVEACVAANFRPTGPTWWPSRMPSAHQLLQVQTGCAYNNYFFVFIACLLRRV